MFYTYVWHGHVHIRSYGQFASSRWRHMLHGLNTSYFHNGQASYTASIPPMVGIEQWRALFLLMWIQSVVFTATISFFTFLLLLSVLYAFYDVMHWVQGGVPIFVVLPAVVCCTQSRIYIIIAIIPTYTIVFLIDAWRVILNQSLIISLISSSI